MSPEISTELPLVSLARSNARNSPGVFCKPTAHLLIGPDPLEGVSVALVVFRPRGGDMGDELVTARPRTPPQVVVTEGVVEQLGLIQPGGMGGCEPGTPPPATGPEVVPGRPGGMTGVAVLDQVHASQVSVAMTELLQLLDVMSRVLGLDAHLSLIHISEPTR